jgi:hypothetical protein
MQPNNRLITATTFSSVNFTYRHNRPHYIFPPLLRIVVWLPKEPSSRSLAYCRDLPLIGRLVQGLMRTPLIVSKRHLDGRWSSKRGKYWYVQPGTLYKVPQLNTKCCRVQMKGLNQPNHMSTQLEPSARTVPHTVVMIQHFTDECVCDYWL